MRSMLEPGCSTVAIIIIIVIMNFTTLYRGAAVQYCTQTHCLMPGPVSCWCADGCDGVRCVVGQALSDVSVYIQDLLAAKVKVSRSFETSSKYHAKVHGVTSRKI